jgi:prefoldin subunit 5
MSHYHEHREYMIIPDDKEAIRQLERRNKELQEYNSVLEKQVDILLKAIALYREELDKYKPAS